MDNVRTNRVCITSSPVMPLYSSHGHSSHGHSRIDSGGIGGVSSGLGGPGNGAGSVNDSGVGGDGTGGVVDGIEGVFDGFGGVVDGFGEVSGGGEGPHDGAGGVDDSGGEGALIVIPFLPLMCVLGLLFGGRVVDTHWSVAVEAVAIVVPLQFVDIALMAMVVVVAAFPLARVLCLLGGCFVNTHWGGEILQYFTLLHILQVDSG